MAEKVGAMRELLTKYCTFSSVICGAETNKSSEALVGSSYGKLQRRLRRIAGKDAHLWEMAKREWLSNNFGSYHCGGYGS